MSQARVCSLESRVEALVQSEGRLKEQVSALEDEKKQLLNTVTHLQDLLASLGIHSPPDGHTLPSSSEGHAASAAAQTEVRREELANRTVDRLLHPLAPPEGS